MTDLNALMNADASAFLASQSAPLQSAPVVTEAPAQAAPAIQVDAPAQPTAIPTEQQPDSGLAAVADPAQPAVAEQPEDEFDIDLDAAPPATDQAEADNVDAALGQNADPDDKVGELLATPRGKRIYSAFKAQQQLAKPDEEGGIGHAPTPEQTREYFRAYVEAQTLANDFQSGTSEGIQRWAAKFFAPQNGQLSQIAAEQLINVLAQQNQQAYIAAAQPVINRYASAAVNRFLQKMESATDDATKQGFWIAAQETHFDATGRYFDAPPAAGQPAPQQQNQPHPAEVELRRLRQQLTEQQHSSVAQQATAIMREIDTSFERALAADVDTALAPIKGKVPDVLYRGARTDYLNRVKESISRNQQALTLLNNSKTAVARQQARQEIPNLVRRFRQMALEPLRQFRAEYLNAAGHEAKAASDQRHAQLQQAASRTEPQATAAAPAQRDLAPAITRQPNETQAQFMGRMMAADQQARQFTR
jgi:hypothetical protein